MTNYLSLNFLEQMKNLDISGGDLSINGFTYPIFQQNGQRGIGPVRNIQGLELLKPKEYENEIFIDKVPCIWSENDLMEYLMQAGVVFFMRFMVNFSGQSRGIAYVQYLGQFPSKLMAERLNQIFRQNNLRLIARVSHNFRRLKIGNINGTVPEDRILDLFRQCNCIEYQMMGTTIIGEKMKTYILTFGNNRQACLARRFLLSHSDTFGSSVFVVWFDKPRKTF